MKVHFNQGLILKIEVCEGDGRRIDKFITNIGDLKQEIIILRNLQNKYGVLEGIELQIKNKDPSKTILDF